MRQIASMALMVSRRHATDQTISRDTWQGECLRRGRGQEWLCRFLEDNGLLGDLHLTVAQAAGALIDVQDGTGIGGLRLDQPERTGQKVLAEQSLTFADDDRKLPEAQRVHQVVFQQRLQEADAAVDLDLAAVLRLELAYGFDDVALDQLELFQSTRSRVLEATHFGRLLRASAMRSSGRPRLARSRRKSRKCGDPGGTRRLLHPGLHKLARPSR